MKVDERLFPDEEELFFVIKNDEGDIEFVVEEDSGGLLAFGLTGKEIETLMEMIQARPSAFIDRYKQWKHIIRVLKQCKS